LRFTIRNKLLLSIIALVVLSTGFLGVYSYRLSSSEIQENKQQELNQLSKELQGVIELNLENASQLMRVMSVNPQVQEYLALVQPRNPGNASVSSEEEEMDIRQMIDLDPLFSFFIDVAEDHPQIETAYLLSPEGISDIISARHLTGANMSDRDYFQRAMEGEQVVSEIMLHRATGNLAFTLAEPIYDPEEQVLGVMAVSLNFEDFVSTHIEDVSLGETGYAWMLDSEGTVISHPEEELVHEANFLEHENNSLQELASRMTAGESGQGFYEFEGDYKYAAFQPVGNWSLAFSMDVDEYMAPAYAIRNGTLLVSIIAILAGLLLALVLSGNISNSIKKLLDGFRNVARGDFTVQLQAESRDEMSQLATSMNETLSSLNHLIARVVQTSGQVNDSSENLAASSEEISASLEEVAASTNEFTRNAQELSESSQAMSASSKEISENAYQGNSAIDEAIQQMQVITEMVENMNAVIVELDHRSQKIGSIVETIQEIAEQTDLLALNAAIEAARAGEQGSGFSVVADEVRKLAEQSSRAASEIAALIEATQEQSRKAVEDMGKGVNEANTGKETIIQTGDIFRTIIAGVDKITEHIESIAAASEQISSGSQQVSASVQEQSATMADISQAAQGLRGAVEQLMDELSRFEYHVQDE